MKKSLRFDKITALISAIGVGTNSMWYEDIYERMFCVYYENPDKPEKWKAMTAKHRGRDFLRTVNKGVKIVCNEETDRIIYG